MTISEAYNAYTKVLVDKGRMPKTFENYTTALFGINGLIAITEDIPVGMINLSHVTDWKMHLRNEGLKPRGINSYLSRLKGLLRWLEEDGRYKVISHTKIANEKEGRGEPRTTLTDEEIALLISHANNLRDKAIISLFFGTGCRPAELRELDRSDWEAATFNPENNVWSIYVLGKREKHRPVFFYQDVKDMVDAYLDSRTDRFKPLFISQRNRRPHPNTIGAMLHKVTRLAGLEKRVTQYVMRHSFATDMAVAGMPVPTLADIMGHSDAVVTQRVYIHIGSHHSQKAYGQFGRKLLTNEA